MSLTRRSVLAGTTAILASCAMAEEAPPRATSLAEIRARFPTPALAAAGQVRDQAVLSWVDGERVLGSGVAATRDDLWHIGSITKSMTACLLARLVEQGALSWDDDIGDVLTDIAPNMHAQYRRANFRHLMTHRSGMPSNVSMLDYVRYRKFNSDPREERQDYTRRALAMAPVGALGETFEYSNNGYIVAGAMMEARLGQSWEALMRAHVFEPLGLRSAGFGAPGAANLIDQPHGHMRNLIGGGVRAIDPGDGDSDNPAVMGPCGTVHISLAEMIAYLAAHRDRSAFLTPSGWDVLHTPLFGGDYAMGWFVRADGKLQHGGWNRRWVAVAHIEPALNLCAFAATNNGDQRRANPAVENALDFAIRQATRAR